MITNIDERGVPLVAGEKGKVVFGIRGSGPADPGTPYGIDYEVAEDLTVTCSEGWKAVITDGYLWFEQVLPEAG